ncbi:MAG: DegT/DnrJ/EryC1/StrS family aminotransferase [Acidimicrobiia bacterium]|nr:DegT/DnrJ/EryC1/StrS family aminotransferase [Acidimicrobiia bacterium]
MSTPVPFMSLAPGEDAADIRAAIDRVIARGWYILGPELEAFEAEFAAASGATHAVGVGTGTDAIALTLRALGIGPGDEVVTSPLSAAYSALAIMMAGATPVFADLDPDRLTLDPARVEASITPRTSAILPVHLYGQPADMAALSAIATRHNLLIVEDACQAHLATAAGRPVGTIGSAGAFSFYPTKNLGALGDAGAIITSDASLAERLRRLRNGGQTTRYHHAEFGVNTRLDDMQAAILRVRLPRLAGWTTRRRALATRYREALRGAPVTVPPERDPGHVYHLFPIRTTRRQAFQAHLRNQGIETLIHYPIPIPLQPALAGIPGSRCPIAEQVCEEVCSLPLHPALTDAEADRIAAAVHAFG